MRQSRRSRDLRYHGDSGSIRAYPTIFAMGKGSTLAGRSGASHTKLDTLGIEYGRLGSAVFLTFAEVPLAKLARWRNLARSTPKIVRLLGSAALPAHFCPYADGPTYWRLSSQRSAAMLHNGRLIAHTLARRIGQSAVRRYRHGAFAALVPPRPWEESEAVAEARQLVEMLADGGFPGAARRQLRLRFCCRRGIF